MTKTNRYENTVLDKENKRKILIKELDMLSVTLFAIISGSFCL